MICDDVPAGRLRIGLVELVGRIAPLDRERDERDEHGPDDEQVKIERRHAEDAGRLVEDDQQRRSQQQHPEQEQGRSEARACGFALASFPLTRPHCPPALGGRASTASTRAIASLVENGLVM